jgi:hypothetical protein
MEERYELLAAGGPCPVVGDELNWENLVNRVLKVGISPLPHDRRQRAYLELGDAPAGLAVESAGRPTSL